MKDLEIALQNKPGQLALLGETLGKHRISLEGGGVFYNGEFAIAHFLVKETEEAKKALKAAGIQVIRINNVLVQKLKQDVPGQLGMFCRKLADEGVNILTQYSDHSNQLIMIVDDFDKGQEISKQWMDK